MTTLFSHLKEFPTHSIHNEIVVWFESQFTNFISVITGPNRNKTTKQYHFTLLGY